jgi:hypothetical protein
VNRPWIWNLVLLFALAVVIARFPAALGEPPVTLPSLAPPPAREPRTLPPSLPPPSEEALQEVVNRNLFSPARGKVEPETAAAATPAPPPAEAAPLKVTLFGVVIEEEGERFAYLQDSSGGGSSRPKKYREGDSFAGAKVKSIRSDRVILEAGSQEQTVNLRTPKEGVPAFKPTSRPANRANPNLSPKPGPAGRAQVAPAPRPARRLQRPDTTARRRRPVTRRQRTRPALRDTDSGAPTGDEWTGGTDGGEDYYQDGYPEAGGDPDLYYEDEEYGDHGNEAPW